MESAPPAARELPEELSARMLNELVYCPRLFYLEWVEGEWADSADTVAAQAGIPGPVRGHSRLPVAARDPMDRDSILRTLRELWPGLEADHGLVSLSLFGSAARGDAREDSDVDLLVEFRDTPGLSEYMAAKFRIEEALGRPVDLVMEGALKDQARSSVEAERIRVA